MHRVQLRKRVVEKCEQADSTGIPQQFIARTPMGMLFSAHSREIGRTALDGSSLGLPLGTGSYAMPVARL